MPRVVRKAFEAAFATESAQDVEHRAVERRR
jgi:hypothetical protein